MILSDTGFMVITTTDCFLLRLNKRAGGWENLCNFVANKIIGKS